ncbi:MAG: hypothetical protein ACI892_000396 [Marinobacter maritimus]|jgi:hypothetical protein
MATMVIAVTELNFNSRPQFGMALTIGHPSN